MVQRRAWMAGLLLLLGASAWAAGHAQSLTGIPDRPPARDFVLRDLAGKSHRLSDYRGRVVIVNFWATWCPPCRREMPSMQRAWQQLRAEGVVLLAVNVGQRHAQVASFASEGRLDFPILLDENGQVSSRWPVIGLPTTFVIDRQGRIVYRAVGDRAWDDPELLAPIRALAQADHAA